MSNLVAKKQYSASLIYLQREGGNCDVRLWTNACAIKAPGNCFIDVNGERVLKSSSGGGGAAAGQPDLRGLNTMIVDPETCRAVGTRQFDTFASNDAASTLVAYLETMRQGAVLVGITAGYPMYKIAPALTTLAAFGLPLKDLQLRGKFAFILQKGFPEKTIVQRTNVTGGALELRIAVGG